MHIVESVSIFFLEAPLDNSSVVQFASSLGQLHVDPFRKGGACSGPKQVVHHYQQQPTSSSWVADLAERSHTDARLVGITHQLVLMPVEHTLSPLMNLVMGNPFNR